MNVGNSTPYMGNSFDKCLYGIFSKGEIDDYIYSNIFDHSDAHDVNRANDIYIYKSKLGRIIDIEHNELRKYRHGIVLWSTENVNSIITENDFYGDPLFLAPHADFSCTGIIVIGLSTGTLMHSWISYNNFYNSRIAMYLNNVYGTSPDLGDFGIEGNIINNDISFSDLQSLYSTNHNSYGVWCEKTKNIKILANSFLRTIPASGAPHDFDIMLRAINIKSINGCLLPGIISIALGHQCDL